MTTKKTGIVLENIDLAKANQMAEQIKLLRAYFTGWENAGRATPPGHEVLWQLHTALREAKEAK